MTGDCHVRILWEPGAEMPRATRPSSSQAQFGSPRGSSCRCTMPAILAAQWLPRERIHPSGQISGRPVANRSALAQVRAISVGFPASTTGTRAYPKQRSQECISRADFVLWLVGGSFTGTPTAEGENTHETGQPNPPRRADGRSRHGRRRGGYSVQPARRRSRRCLAATGRSDQCIVNSPSAWPRPRCSPLLSPEKTLWLNDKNDACNQE